MQAIRARQLERRDHADQQGGSERQGDREAKHAAVDDDLVQPRQHRAAERDLKGTLRVRRPEFAHERDAADRQSRTEETTDDGEHEAVRDQLSHDASAAGTNGTQPRRKSRKDLSPR